MKKLLSCILIVVLLSINVGVNTKSNSTVKDATSGKDDKIIGLTNLVDKKIILKKKITAQDLRVPPTQEDMKYLGMNGGNLTVASVNKEIPLGLLNLKVKSPTVNEVIHLNGYYFSFTNKNQVFKSKNLKSWTKSSWKLPKGFSNKLTAYDDNKYVAIDKGGICVTQNGVKWSRILNGPLKTEKLSKPALANNVLCVLDSTITTTRIKKMNGLVYVRLPHKTYNNLVSDGKAFAADLQKQPKNAKVTNPIFISKDGVHWKDTNIASGKTDDYYGSFSMIRYKSRRYICSYSYNCFNNFWIYELTQKNGSYIKRRFKSGMDPTYKMLGKIADSKERYVTMIFTNIMKNYFQDIDIKENVYVENDYLQLILPFCETFKLIYINNHVFKVGKYGFISIIDENFVWSWSGLYQYKYLAWEELINPNIGCALGVRLVGNTLWYSYKAKRTDGSYEIFSSIDGKRWTYVFNDDKKVNVNSLEGEALKEHIEESYDE